MKEVSRIGPKERGLAGATNGSHHSGAGELSAIKRSTRGAVIVEFALIMPVLGMIYLTGMVMHMVASERTAVTQAITATARAAAQMESIESEPRRAALGKIFEEAYGPASYATRTLNDVRSFVYTCTAGVAPECQTRHDAASAGTMGVSYAEIPAFTAGELPAGMRYTLIGAYHRSTLESRFGIFLGLFGAQPAATLYTAVVPNGRS